MKTLIVAALLLTGCTKEVNYLVSPDFESELWLKHALDRHVPGYPGNWNHNNESLWMYTNHGIIYLVPGEPAHDLNESSKAFARELDEIERAGRRLVRASGK